MRFSFFLISLLFLSSLHAQDFEIIEATSQKWTGGRASSGYGVNFKITLVYKKKLKMLSFDKLWLKKEAFPLKVAKKKSEKTIFLKNDTIFLTARKKVRTNEYGDAIKKDEKEQKPPVNFKAEALIHYKVKRKNKYLLISELKKLKAIYYP